MHFVLRKSGVATSSRQDCESSPNALHHLRLHALARLTSEMQQLEPAAAPRLGLLDIAPASTEGGGAVLDPSSIAALLEIGRGGACGDAAAMPVATSASPIDQLAHAASTRRRRSKALNQLAVGAAAANHLFSSTLGQDSGIDILLALAAAPNLSVRAEALGVLWNLSATAAGQEAAARTRRAPRWWRRLRRRREPSRSSPPTRARAAVRALVANDGAHAGARVAGGRRAPCPRSARGAAHRCRARERARARALCEARADVAADVKVRRVVPARARALSSAYAA